MGYLRNAIRIDAPVDDVFRLTNNVRTWPTLFSECESSEVFEEKPGRVTFRLRTHPDENGQQRSWIARRETDVARRSTYSRRMPSSGPFEEMEIRWWYDSLGPNSTVMTWEQEFTMSPQVHVTEAQATDSLNKRARMQQQVIKERVEQMCGGGQQQASPQRPSCRGMIVGRYTPGSEP